MSVEELDLSHGYANEEFNWKKGKKVFGDKDVKNLWGMIASFYGADLAITLVQVLEDNPNLRLRFYPPKYKHTLKMGAYYKDEFDPEGKYPNNSFLVVDKYGGVSVE